MPYEEINKSYVRRYKHCPGLTSIITTISWNFSRHHWIVQRLRKCSVVSQTSTVRSRLIRTKYCIYSTYTIFTANYDALKAVVDY